MMYIFERLKSIILKDESESPCLMATACMISYKPLVDADICTSNRG